MPLKICKELRCEELIFQRDGFKTAGVLRAIKRYSVDFKYWQG